MIDLPPRLALTVGPVLYHWPRQQLFDFYAEVADSAADSVVLGQTVCSRRRELKPDDWLALARELAAQGKDVVLATQTLVESEADLRALRQQVEQFTGLLEAGDASALQLLAGKAPFVIGPHINIYSRPALLEHAKLGAVRWVAPAELSLAALAQINPPGAPVHSLAGTPIATEVLAFGRLSLAFSARCFTARHHHLHKDDCAYRCIDDPDGLLLASGEGQPFLVLNGTQTQSAAYHCLIGEAAALRAAGVTRLRLSPQSQGFAHVLATFDGAMNHGASAAEALLAIEATHLSGGLSNGFAHQRPGLDWVNA